MISVHVESKRVTQNLIDLGAAVDEVVDADIRQVLTNAAYDLSMPGSPISYPVSWDSEKQHRAFFATKGFGRGIPTPRTGVYNKGWGVAQTGYKLVDLDLKIVSTRHSSRIGREKRDDFDVAVMSRIDGCGRPIA